MALSEDLRTLSPNLGDFFCSLYVLNDGCQKDALAAILQEVEGIESKVDESMEESERSRDHISFEVLYKKKKLCEDVKRTLLLLMK